MGIFAQLHAYTDIGIFSLRLAIAMIFLVHGIWKMRHGSQVAHALNMEKSGWFFTSLGYAECAGAIALLAGLLTQPAAFGLGLILLGAMYFKIEKWRIPFSAHDKTGWEFDLMLLAACIYIFAAGGGKIALDRIFFSLF